MTYREKTVPVMRSFVLDKEISFCLELSRLTRCTRRMTRTPQSSAPEEVSSIADSPAMNRMSTASHIEQVRAHPETWDLERFLRGELSGDSGRMECRKIVRHLLTGCPRCLQITGRLWTLGEPAEPQPAESRLD